MATSVKKLLEKYNDGFIQCLPMNDSSFIDILIKKGLLSDDVKSSIDQLNTSTEKSSYFIECVIKKQFDNGNNSSFTNLLDAMKESNHAVVKDLALQIQRSLHVNSKNTILGRLMCCSIICVYIANIIILVEELQHVRSYKK